MKRIGVFLFLFTCLLLSQPQKRSIIGIDENLGGQIPLGLRFTNEKGEKIALRQVINKPTILMFVYFECPGLCTPLMSEVASEVSSIGLKPGVDYKIVSVSFDPTETSDLAAGKKKNYVTAVKIPFPEDAWSFLVGDSASVATLTDVAGFRYKKENDEFIHGGALIMVSPTGKITRYLLGTDFLPFDIKMGLIEASAGKTSPTIAKMLKFCFKYDPEGRKYTLNVTRIAGSLIIFGACIFMLFVIRGKRKKVSENKV